MSRQRQCETDNPTEIVSRTRPECDQNCVRIRERKAASGNSFDAAWYRDRASHAQLFGSSITEDRYLFLSDRFTSTHWRISARITGRATVFSIGSVK